jgi:hypothetical protein
MKLIKRTLEAGIKKSAKKMPVIAVLGPRQSGKTTLVKEIFKKHEYISLEDYDNREFAKTDPRGFLDAYAKNDGLILDEVQHVPELLSYVQTWVDNDYKPGFFVVTGSQNFLLNQAVSQTLAGRVSIHTLLPFSITELQQADLLPKKSEEAVFKGFYPPIYARGYDPRKWYADYIKTYVERDVRTLTAVSDLNIFQKFLRLCAGRMGQVVNLTALGNDCGVSYNTVRSWLSILEASYIVYLLQPYHTNFSKRLIKSPKLYFYDTGLACSLLGIEQPEQIVPHYLKGGLFEGMIISDVYKLFYNSDREPKVYFWRDKTGHEVDCLFEKATEQFAVEIKAGKTIQQDFFINLNWLNQQTSTFNFKNYVVYGGDEDQKRTAAEVLGWKSIFKMMK